MKKSIHPQTYSFIRYLASKKTVDDRALNQGVWKTLVSEVQQSFKNRNLRILELGAGIGTMVERLLEWDLFSNFQYTAVDAESENTSNAIVRTSNWAQYNNFQIQQTTDTTLLIKGIQSQAALEFEIIDSYEFLEANQGKRLWDLVIAHAFLDLVNIPRTLQLISKIADRCGYFYFTLNYDGLTSFQPEIDKEFEGLILNQYHRTMDERFISGKPSGDSCSGRHLFNYLPQAGYQILDSGSSDWVVFPESAVYLHDEAYFLHYIINTIQEALIYSPIMDIRRLKAWVFNRHRQIDGGELTYIAHQLDFFGHIHGPTD